MKPEKIQVSVPMNLYRESVSAAVSGEGMTLSGLAEQTLKSSGAHGDIVSFFFEVQGAETCTVTIEYFPKTKSATKEDTGVPKEHDKTKKLKHK